MPFKEITDVEQIPREFMSILKFVRICISFIHVPVRISSLCGLNNHLGFCTIIIWFLFLHPLFLLILAGPLNSIYHQFLVNFPKANSMLSETMSYYKISFSLFNKMSLIVQQFINLSSKY